MIQINNSAFNLKLQNSILNSYKSFQTSLQRLITGLKINSPSDDPFGFYIASRFTTQIRGLETANKNIQAAATLLGIADESIEEINEIMGQIRELVSQSTSEYLTPEERAANQEQINKLFAQAKQIKEKTAYNGKLLFDGTTLLDKNTTYYNNAPSSANIVSASSYNVATTAANQALTPATTMLTLNSSGTAAPSAAQPETQSETSDEAIYENPAQPYAETLVEDSSFATTEEEELSSEPLILLDEDPEGETIVSTPAIARMSLRSAAPEATTYALSAPAETGTSGDEGIALMSLTEDTSGTLNIAASGTETLTVAGKTYTVKDNSSSANSLTWSYDEATDQITFEGSNLTITAADGQEDNIKLTGSSAYTDIYTGDMNDTITNDATGNYTGIRLYGDAGDDIIIVTGDSNNIYGESGSNLFTINGSDNYVMTSGNNEKINITGDDNEIYGSNNGANTISISGDANYVIGGEKNDTITIIGNNNDIDANNGNDYTSIISGKNNTVLGGEGYDKVYNGGTNTTYGQMNELVNGKTSYNIQTGNSLNTGYTISTGINIPDITIDVSSRESAISALSQIDEIILGLTSSRVELDFQKNILDNNLKTNLTRISNLTDSRATLIDADTATEYNNLISQASLISNAQLLQTQLQQNYASSILSLINGLAG